MTPHTHTAPHLTQAFYDDLASRSYVEDINLLCRGPTPAGASTQTKPSIGIPCKGGGSIL